MRRLHLAYLCADRGVPVGGSKGASVHVRAVAQALCRRGHRVSLLASRVDGPPPGFAPRLIDVGFDRTLKDLKRAMAPAAGASSLPSEVHGLLMGCRVLEALGELHARRPIDAIYERYSLWSWAGLRFARERRVPLLLEVNAPLVAEQRAYRDLHLEAVARALEGELLARADAVLVPSEELRAHVEKTAGRTEGVHVVPNGVDPELFAAPPPLPPRAAEPLTGRFVLAFAGSLKPWHGVEVLLAAFARLRRRLPEAHLLVLGDGPLRPAVEEAAERIGRRHLTVTGAVAHREVAAWLGHADVGLAPYPPLEGFYFSPLKVVEYQAAGLPVVASSVGQVARQVDHGRTGLLVPPGDEEGIVRAVLRLCGDRRLARRMGRRGRRRALKRCGWERVAERVEEILEAGRPAPAPAAAGAAAQEVFP